MAGELGIDISPNFFEWIRGFGDLVDTMIDDMGHGEWQALADDMLERSQNAVHVITGQLKRSGFVEITGEGDDLIASVVYDTEYAAFEHARGGDHAYLQIAYDDTFRGKGLRGIVKAYEEATSRWR